MKKQSFAERHGIKIRPDTLASDYVTLQAKKEFFKILSGSVNKNLELAAWAELYEACCDATNEVIDRALTYHRYEIEQIINRCKWHEFYEICEKAWFLINEDEGSTSPFFRIDSQEFSKEVNKIFIKYGLGYQMRDGLIERISDIDTNERIEQARLILQEPEYKGPAKQFNKAVGFFSQRPEPDPANCVKDAVGAIEGVARIISGEKKAVLTQLLDREPFKSGMPPTLRGSIEKLYAYRGDAPGAGHGQVAESSVGIEEAEFVLGISASAIVYMAKKRGKSKVP